ncbi:MAG: hypothetical protein ACYDIC_13750 [Desulfobaccales bacterium]
MSDLTWLDTIKESLKSQGATWFIGLCIAIMTLFSSHLIESIKFVMNRADLRTNQYEALATEISQYIFAAELTVEYIEKDWTTKQTLEELIKDYNQSITTMRKKEFVYLAWIRKYWSREQVNQYDKFMQSVRAFDSAIHSLNDEIEAVRINGSKKKIDRKRSEEVLKVMKPAVENMRENGKLFLTSLG